MNTKIMRLPRNARRVLIAASTIALILNLSILQVEAAPFATCPTVAFLAQGKPAVLYGVDLTTGLYDQLGDLSTSDKLNGMGFNYHDSYLYAWYYQGQTLARIHGDYSIEPLSLSPTLQSDYFVGDVAVNENAYYIYRKNGAYSGLWRIALDPQDNDYLSPQQIIEGSSLYLNIFDFAFHPTEASLYSVDNKGKLLRISSSTGVVDNLGNVGESGTFGAVYFDANGTLYVSRNQDGRVFSVDVGAATPSASFFSYGPSSSNNDGARCALAPVTPPETPTMDFGDAPESYGTLARDDGARHLVDGEIFLGSLVDTENRAFPAPDESDDSKDGSDDEDGIQFLTALTLGEQAIISADMNGSGYLSLWIDFDRNGSFDSNELVIDDASNSDPSGFFSVEVPLTASVGDTWVRARFSSSENLGATGLANDGEVEDYPVTLSLSQTTTEYYPSANGYVTLAYEDLWPSRGDYDLNDFVVYYRTAITRENSNVGAGNSNIQLIHISGEIVAVGASFHSGFAVSIPGLQTADIDVANVELLINGQQPLSSEGGTIVPFQPLRGTVSRQTETALLEITRDVWNTVERGEGCSFHRTENNCGAAASATFSLTVPVIGAVPAIQVQQGIFNPFIFATEDRLRNSIFRDEEGNIIPPGNALEIHLKNRAPSWRADSALLGRADDRSDAGSVNNPQPLTYQNAQGLPWAIEIGGRWCHPSEYQDLTLSYPEFLNFVASEGQQSGDWFYTTRAAEHPQLGPAGYLYSENGVLDSQCEGVQ